ncbi:MAG: phosphoribosylformylglycinamidine cyclo-ligase [bacterium]|nr:phosphoribosylformylglycinamidine cyclo-ligase [bacterium]
MDQTPKRGLTYRDAGVDIDAQDNALDRIKDLVRSTRTPGVLSELGSFGGLFALDEAAGPTILVSSADGVGTKLCLAFLSGVHNTCGRDLVNHCVNDILVQGARPLFFLDYIATGRLEPHVLAEVVEGIAAGCRENGCALLGGETAEMPGFYSDGEYDVAGFIVGAVQRDRLLDGRHAATGDVLIGLPSSGLHTNGYSLARKIFFEVEGLAHDDRVAGLDGTVGELLLAEHRSYLEAVAPLLAAGSVHALAHITGGGLTDNLPRVLPEGTSARISRASWEVPALFRFMQEKGGVDEAEMFRTFNMGIGMVLVVAPSDAAAVEKSLDEAGEQHLRIGDVVAGSGDVVYA